MPCVRLRATLWLNTEQFNLEELKPVMLFRVCTKVNQSRIWPFFFFFQNQNTNVSALKNFHDTGLFIWATAKWTGLELVPNLAKLLPSLACWFVWQHWQAKRRFTLPGMLHMDTGLGSGSHSLPVCCVTTASLRERLSFNELVVKGLGWDLKAIFGEYGVLWPFISTAVTCQGPLWWWELSYLFSG